MRLCAKASLVEMDLQVMRQLLMLNDQVEEMKWQRRRQLMSSTSCFTPSIDEELSEDAEQRWTTSRFSTQLSICIQLNGVVAFSRRVQLPTPKVWAVGKLSGNFFLVGKFLTKKQTFGLTPQFLRNSGV